MNAMNYQLAVGGGLKCIILTNLSPEASSTKYHEKNVNEKDNENNRAVSVADHLLNLDISSN